MNDGQWGKSINDIEGNYADYFRKHFQYSLFTGTKQHKKLVLRLTYLGNVVRTEKSGFLYPVLARFLWLLNSNFKLQV